MTTMLLQPTLEQLAEAHVDLTKPGIVEVEIGTNGVLWVNVNGICVLRCCRIDVLTVRDNREPR